MNKLVSTRLKQESTKMNVSRMRKKQTPPLTFSGFKKNQSIDLMQHLERYTNTLPVFGFNSGRYDINLIKSYLIPYLINEKTEPSVMKKANDFVSFKFGDVQLLDIMKFLGGATTLDSFLKAYKASELK